MFLPPYPPRHSGVGPLFELRVCGKAVPHDVGRVVLVPQLWTALKQEVYDEEFDTGIQAWRREGKGGRKQSQNEERGEKTDMEGEAIKKILYSGAVGKN